MDSSVYWYGKCSACGMQQPINGSIDNGINLQSCDVSMPQGHFLVESREWLVLCRGIFLCLSCWTENSILILLYPGIKNELLIPVGIGFARHLSQVDISSKVTKSSPQLYNLLFSLRLRGGRFKLMELESWAWETSEVRALKVFLFGTGWSVFVYT
jgi:hypothetical protein